MKLNQLYYICECTNVYLLFTFMCHICEDVTFSFVNYL